MSAYIFGISMLLTILFILPEIEYPTGALGHCACSETAYEHGFELLAHE